MHKYTGPLIVMTFVLGFGCRTSPPLNAFPPPVKSSENETIILPGEALVLIKTTKGDIRIKLYSETPKHRDNFLKLVEQHFYDSLLFHRVIKGFVAQGGDPVSKNAKPDFVLGDGDVGYTIPAELDPKLYHKRGALGAARESDFITPERASSGCQFYIVIGKTWNDSLLKVQGKRNDRYAATNNLIRNPANAEFVARYKKYQNIPDSMKVLSVELERLLVLELPKVSPRVFTEEQKKTYQTEGGTPHLDGSYTVFGEVIEGMNVVDLIAQGATDSNDRPLTNVRILTVEILKKP